MGFGNMLCCVVKNQHSQGGQIRGTEEGEHQSNRSEKQPSKARSEGPLDLSRNFEFYQVVCCLQELHLKQKYPNTLKVKEQKKMYQANLYCLASGLPHQAPGWSPCFHYTHHSSLFFHFSSDFPRNSESDPSRV